MLSHASGIICCVLYVYSNAYIFHFFHCLSLLFYSQLYVGPLHTTFWLLFFLGMVLIPASCTISRTSTHISSGTLSVPWIYLSLPLYLEGIWFRSYMNGLVVFPTFFSLSLHLAIRSSWSEPQSGPSLVFAGCIELLHLWLQWI